MPAPAKLTEEVWANVRSRWESDPRKGYDWLVIDMGLPVTRSAVRNKAIRERWCKKMGLAPRIAMTTSPHCCCRNHAHTQKTQGRREHNQMEILSRLTYAIEVIAECSSALIETMPQGTHR